MLPYHLSAQTQLAGLLALRHVPEMEARVARIAEERGRVAAALGDLPVDSWPSDANFILFRPRDRDADEVWRSLLAHSVLIRNCASWDGLARLPARHHRDRRGERPLPPRLEGEPVTTARPPRREGTRPRRRPPSTPRSWSTARASPRSPPACRSSTTWSSSWAATPRFDLDGAGHGRPPRRRAPHRRGRRASSSGGCLAEALGDKAGIRRFASMAAAPRRGARRGGPRPVGAPLPGLRARVRPRHAGPGHAALRPAAGRGVLARLRHRGRRSPCTSGGVEGKNTHHMLEASFKGVARCLRDAVRVEGGGIPSTKGSL